MTEQEKKLLDETAARANLTTQKLNELLHNDSVKSDVETKEEDAAHG